MPALERRGALGVAGAGVAALWLGGWVARWRFASPNVDDYLYTSLGRGIGAEVADGDLGAAAAHVLNSGPSSPIIPVLTAPLAHLGPDIAVLVQLPVLLLLGWFVFRSLEEFLPWRESVIVAAAFSLWAPILGWSLMVHMALLSSALTMASIHFLVRSRGFTVRQPSVLFGLALGLLALSRSLAPVYVAALLVSALVVTLVFHGLPRGRERLVSLGLSAAVALAVAGPWWLRSGSKTLRYLLDAGYEESDAYAVGGNPIVGRLRTIGEEWGLAVVVLGLVLLAVIVRDRVRGHPRTRDAERGAVELRAACVLFAVVLVALLATSENEGTAFAHPALAPLVVAVVGSAVRSGLARQALIAGAGVLAGSGVLLSWAPGLELGKWVPSSVYAHYVSQALGADDSSARTGHVHREMAALVGDETVFFMRDDPLLNANGMVFEKLDQGLAGTVLVHSYDPAAGVPPVPAGANIVVAGESCVPYHRNLDAVSVAEALRQSGFRLVREWTYSSCNRVEVWRRT